MTLFKRKEDIFYNNKKKISKNMLHVTLILRSLAKALQRTKGKSDINGQSS